MRRIFFSLNYEKAELLTVAIVAPVAFLCSAVQYPDIGPDQYAYYHDWYFNHLTFMASMIQSLGVGCLVALLVGFFSPELAKRWEHGLTLDVKRQIVLAVSMVSVFIFYFSVLDQLLRIWGITIPKQEWQYATSTWERYQALSISLINGPAEEFLRVYFIAKIKSLTKNSAAAILGSAAIFAVYHVAYGWATVAYFFVFGIICGWLYLERNYFLALIAWHILADMTAMIYPAEWRVFMGLLGIPWG